METACLDCAYSFEYDPAFYEKKTLAVPSRCRRCRAQRLARRVRSEGTSRLFRWAVEERKVQPSQFPLSGMRSRFQDKKRTRYYDPDEIRRLLESINDPATWWPDGVSPDAITDRDRLRAAVHRCYFRRTRRRANSGTPREPPRSPGAVSRRPSSLE